MIPYLLPSPANLLLGVYLLKTTFSIRSMYDHVVATLGEDRKHAVQKLVSRDVSELSDPYLNSATIESVAENTVDGFIAPIFYFVLFGLTGAMVYRAVNTLDAMVGYRDQRYEYFGKFAARLDDVLTFIPSRISVLLYFPFKPKKVWKYYRMAKFKINGDKPVACMSAVLGVWLEKKGVYRFEGRKPEIEDVKRALKVFLAVVIEWAVVCTIILGLAITSELDIFRKLLYSMRV
jgi:adenosylcobinamide-phosphate synthase